MSQDWTDNVFQGTHVAQTDMQNIENNLLALESCFSGASAPGTSTPGMWYFDTDGYGTFYARDKADANWRKIFAFEAGGTLDIIGLVSGTVMEFGQATSPTGWTKKTDWQDGAMIVINSDADGTALARDGSVKAETVHTHSAGTLAADNESTHTHAGPSHNHQWYTYSATVTNSTFNSGGSALNLGATNLTAIGIRTSDSAEQSLTAHQYTNNAGTGATGAGAAHGHAVSGASAANTQFYFQEAIWCTKD